MRDALSPAVPLAVPVPVSAEKPRAQATRCIEGRDGPADAVAGPHPVNGGVEAVDRHGYVGVREKEE
jgi:hypothetical protein